jgi:predicted  nucleic acid-binding Zn-ribbon protein
MARNNRPTNDQLDSKLNEIKKNVENYQALLDNYKTAFGDIETLSATIKTFDEDAKKITAIKSTMEKHQTNIEEIKDGIEEYHTELLSDEENETIKDKIEDVFNRIKGYEKELLEGDDSLSNQIKSIKDDLEKYKENWGAFEGQSKKDWETFKKERNTE